MADRNKVNRRQYGSGSVSQRASDGRWIGAISDGWTANGTRRRRTVTATTEAECKRKLDRLRADMNRGATSSPTTVKAWSEKWLRTVVHDVAPKTYLSHQSSVKQWIVPVVGGKRLDRLTAADVRAVVNSARDAQHLPAGRRARAVFLKMLRDAIADGHHVPAAALSKEKKARRQLLATRGTMLDGHAKAVLTVAAGLPDGSRWMMALHTGARQGECLGLTWDRVDFRNRTIDLSWQLQALPYITGRSGALQVPDDYEHIRLVGALCLVRPKSEKGRRLVPMSAALYESLRDWYAVRWDSPHGMVWPRSADDGRPRAANEDRAEWHALQLLAGVRRIDGKPYQLHELRHTAASEMLKAGISPEVIKEVLGHSAVLTTMTYAHVDRSLTTAAVAALDRALS